MRIDSLNYVNQRQQSFSGLWGKFVSRQGNKIIEKNAYYLFKNETKPAPAKQGMEAVEEASVIPGKLPFTFKEFILYMHNRLPIVRSKMIENHIMMKNLSTTKV